MNTGLDQINVNQRKARPDQIRLYQKDTGLRHIHLFRGTLIISTFPRITLDLIISSPGQASARQAAFSGGSDSQCLGVLGALSDRSRGVTNDLTSNEAAATPVCTRCCPTRWATDLGEP